MQTTLAGVANAQLPLQLYRRARPWFLVVVRDMDTMTEIGCSSGLSYRIHRLQYGKRGLRPRSARLSASYTATGVDRGNNGDVRGGGGWPEKGLSCADLSCAVLS